MDIGALVYGVIVTAFAFGFLWLSLKVFYGNLPAIDRARMCGISMIVTGIVLLVVLG